MHDLIRSFVFAIFWFCPFGVFAQNASALQKQAQQRMEQGEKFAQQAMFQQAVQQFQQALSLLRQSLKKSQNSDEKKSIQKSLQSCLCNGGYYAEQNQQFILARSWYQQCLTTGLAPQAEATVQQALRKINADILRITATITIRSTPAGVRVQLLQRGGSGRFETTPFTVQIDPGNYTIILQSPGYEPQQTSLKVASKSMIIREYTLKKMGTLFVQTVPSQAQIRLTGSNGFKQDAETPTTQHLPAGHYSLVIKKAGYQTHHAQINLQSGMLKRKNISLIPQNASLLIETSPPQARIELRDASGKKLLGVSPFTAQVASGSLHLTVRKSGYHSIAQTITAQTGARIEKRYDLKVFVSPQQQLARTVAWSFVGVTVATLGTGIVLFVLAQGDLKEVESKRGNPQTSNEDINNLYYRGVALHTAAITLSIVGGAALVTSAGLFIWNGGKPKESPLPPETPVSPNKHLQVQSNVDSHSNFYSFPFE